MARRAGLRPRSLWLAPGLLCAGVGLALPSALTLGSWDSPERWDRFLSSAWLLPAASLGCALAATALSGGLGWVRREPRLGRVGPLDGAWGPALVGALALVVMAWALRGAPAGAARAVDASAAGLLAMWGEWLRRGLVTLGCVSLAAAALDLWLARRRIWRALHETSAEARERARG